MLVSLVNIRMRKLLQNIQLADHVIGPNMLEVLVK